MLKKHLDLKKRYCFHFSEKIVYYLFFVVEERKRKTKLPYFEIMMKTVCLRCWHLIDLNSNSKELVFPSRKLKGIIAKHFLQHFSHFTEIWKGQKWNKIDCKSSFMHVFFIRKLYCLSLFMHLFLFMRKLYCDHLFMDVFLFMRNGFFYQSVPFFAKSLRIR